MAALPPITSIKREDFPGQSWAERLLWPLNRFMSAVYAALNQDLTFTENMRAQVRELRITYDTSDPVKFAWTLRQRPTDLWITSVTPRSGGADPTAAVYARWTFDGTSIVLNEIFGLTSGDQYTIRIIIASN